MEQDKTTQEEESDQATQIVPHTVPFVLRGNVYVLGVVEHFHLYQQLTFTSSPCGFLTKGPVPF